MAGRIAPQGKRSQVHPVSNIKDSAGSQTSAKENQAVVKSPPIRKVAEGPQSGAVRQPLQGTQSVNKTAAPLLEAHLGKVADEKGKGATGDAKAQSKNSSSRAVTASSLKPLSDELDKLKKESLGLNKESAAGGGQRQKNVSQKGSPPLLPTPSLEAVESRSCLSAGNETVTPQVVDNKGSLQTAGSLSAAGSANGGSERKGSAKKAARRKEREPWRDPGPKDTVEPQRSKSKSDELKTPGSSAQGAGLKVQDSERVKEGQDEGVTLVAVVDPQRVVADGAAGAHKATTTKKTKAKRRTVEEGWKALKAERDTGGGNEALESAAKPESRVVKVKAASKAENTNLEGSGPEVNGIEGEGKEEVARSPVAGEAKEEQKAVLTGGAEKEAGGQQEQPSDEEGWMKVKKVRKKHVQRQLLSSGGSNTL